MLLQFRVLALHLRLLGPAGTRLSVCVALAGPVLVGQRVELIDRAFPGTHALCTFCAELRVSARRLEVEVFAVGGENHACRFEPLEEVVELAGQLRIFAYAASWRAPVPDHLEQQLEEAHLPLRVC